MSLDFGAARPLKALVIQADADDSYVVEGSRDGRLYFPVWTAFPGPGAGMLFRSGDVGGTPVRHLRLRAAGGDGNYAVSELIALCQEPLHPLVTATAAAPGSSLRPTYRQVRAVKLAVALLGLALFLQRWRARRRGGPPTRVWDVALAALGIAGALCWWNLGAFHGRGYVHHEDVFHHFLGAKYFAELGYDRLYDCAAAADAEAGLEEWVLGRTLRDLRTGRMVPGADLLRRSGDCAAAFTPGRWREFTSDLAWFRTWITPPSWDLLMRDYGYNATPLWGLAASLLTSRIAVSDGGVLALALLDPLLLAALWALLAGAFGWRAAALAAVWWGTNLPAEFGWTGGAFLRQDWLLLTVAAVCLARRQRWELGGAALAWAVLLRVYPGFLAAGLVLKALAGMRRRSFSLEPGHRRFAAGFLATLALLVALSSVANPRGVGAWVEFAGNRRVDLAAGATNQLGLRTLLAYDRERLLGTVAESVRDPGEAVNLWQQARLGVPGARGWAWAAVLLAFVILLYRRARSAEDWEALVLGVGLVAFAAPYLSYYAAVFLLYGLLREGRGEVVGLVLCSLSAWTQGALLLWPRASEDEQRFLAINLGLVLAVALITALRAPDRRGHVLGESPGVC